MRSQIPVVIILCNIFAIDEGLPIDNTIEQMDTRDLGDYFSWFWSPTENIETKPQNENADVPQSFGEIKPVEEVSKQAKVEDVDDVLAELQDKIKDSNDDETIGAYNFLENLKKTIDTNPSEYLEMTINKIKHLVYIGGLGTPTRTRGVRCVGGMMSPLSIVVALIYSLFGGVTNSIFGGNSLYGGLVKSSGMNNNILGLIGGGNTTTKISNGSANGRANTADGIFTNIMKMQPQVINKMDPLALAKIIALIGGNEKRNSDDSNNTSSTSKLKIIDNSGEIKANTSPRIVILRPDDDDDNNNRGNSSKSLIRLYEIDGTPNERLRKLKEMYNPNLGIDEKVFIFDELNRLKRESSSDSSLMKDINILFEDLKRSPKDYNEIIRIIQRNQNENRDSDINGIIRVIDGSRKGHSSNSDNTTMDILYEKINEAMKNGQVTRIDDPEVIQRLRKSIDIRQL